MPFQNPIVAGTTLVRQAVQSRNYVAGVSGWRIGADGSSEFNSGTFRGDLIVGTPANGEVIISTTVPSDVSSFYGADTTPDQVFIGQQASTGDYWYEIAGMFTGSSPNMPFHAEGFVHSGTVFEIMRATQTVGASVGFITIGLVAGTHITLGAGVTGSIGLPSGGRVLVQSPVFAFFDTVDLRYGGQSANSRSMSRGPVAVTHVTTVGDLTTTASAETDITNYQTTVDFRNGRDYEIEVQAHIVGTVAGDTYAIRVRRDTALTGNNIGRSDGQNTETRRMTAIYKATADETGVTLFVSHARTSGTGTFKAQGESVAGSSRAFIIVRDLTATSEVTQT